MELVLGDCKHNRRARKSPLTVPGLLCVFSCVRVLIGSEWQGTEHPGPDLGAIKCCHLLPVGPGGALSLQSHPVR